MIDWLRPTAVGVVLPPVTVVSTAFLTTAYEARPVYPVASIYGDQARSWKLDGARSCWYHVIHEPYGIDVMFLTIINGIYYTGICRRCSDTGDR